MMIEVFVHPGSPFGRREPPEEAMRMLRATLCTTLEKPLNQVGKTLFFYCKVALLAHNKALVRR